MDTEPDIHRMLGAMAATIARIDARTEKMEARQDDHEKRLVLLEGASIETRAKLAEVATKADLSALEVRVMKGRVTSADGDITLTRAVGEIHGRVGRLEGQATTRSVGGGAIGGGAAVIIVMLIALIAGLLGVDLSWLK